MVTNQGGVETPDLFSIVIEHLPQNVGCDWAMQSFGTHLVEQGSSSRRLTHMIWCDIVFLFAHDSRQLQEIIHRLTCAIYHGGFRWKASSLEVMVGGDAISDEDESFSCIDSDGTHLVFMGDRLVASNAKFSKYDRHSPLGRFCTEDRLVASNASFSKYVCHSPPGRVWKQLSTFTITRENPIRFVVLSFVQCATKTCKLTVRRLLWEHLGLPNMNRFVHVSGDLWPCKSR